MEKLKPCPFCGGEAAVYSINLFRAEIQVICKKCRNRTLAYKGGDYDDTKYLVTQAWNRRVNDDK